MAETVYVAGESVQEGGSNPSGARVVVLAGCNEDGCFNFVDDSAEF